LSDTDDISDSLKHLMAYVMSRVCLGNEGFDDPELIDAYIGLNNDSGTVFQISNLLPSFIARIFSDAKVHKHYATIKKKKFCLSFINGASLRLVLPSTRKRTTFSGSSSMLLIITPVWRSLWQGLLLEG